MILKFDIAIVGSGLTGNTAAIALSGLGYKVALIDPISFDNKKNSKIDTRTTAL